MSHIIRKHFLVMIGLFCLTPCTIFPQDDQQNLLKYWYYRDRLKHFVVPGLKQGESEIAGTRDYMNTSESWSNIDFAQHTIYFGYYLGTLATEYRILKDNQQTEEAAKTEHEIVLALNQFISYMDKCENYWGDCNTNSDYCPEFNGFFIRRNVPYQFLNENDDLGKTEATLQNPSSNHIDLLNEDLTVDNLWDIDKFIGLPPGHPGWLINTDISGIYDPTHIRGRVDNPGNQNEDEEGFAMSQDEAIGLLMGLSLTTQCMSDANEVVPAWGDTPDGTAKVIAKKVLDHIFGLGSYIIVDPDGDMVPLGGDANFFRFGYRMAHVYFGGDIIPYYPQPWIPVGYTQMMCEWGNWNSLRLIIGTDVANDAMESTLAAIGDSWYSHFCPSPFPLQNITYNSIYAKMIAYNYIHTFYLLLYKVLHPIAMLGPEIIAIAKEQLDAAPGEGIHNYPGDPDNQGSNGWRYTYKWRGKIDEQNNGSVEGNFCGLDYSLLYNLLILATNTSAPYYHQYKELFLSQTWPKILDEGGIIGNSEDPAVVIALKSVITDSHIVNTASPLNPSIYPGNVTYTAQKSIKIINGFKAEHGVYFNANLKSHVFWDDFKVNNGHIKNSNTKSPSKQIYNLSKDSLDQISCTSNIVEDKFKGLETQSSLNTNDIIIFPNPASTFVTIFIKSGTLDIYTLEIYDLSQRLILRQDISKDNINLDIRDFTEGLYIVKIYTKKINFISKLTVVK